MSGYRESSFDPDSGPPINAARKASWWKTILFVLAYMIPLFWLWNRTDFPDSFGIHITAHGKVGLTESWYYSYLLLERHRILDVVTFIYMWVVIVGFVGWVAFKQLRKIKFSLYSDAE